jgi:hypothetical protein
MLPGAVVVRTLLLERLTHADRGGIHETTEEQGNARTGTVAAIS